MTIKVCVGSSCHLKGSYDVIEAFKEVLKKYDVEDLVELQASFCLGHCAKGVTVSCEGEECAAGPAAGGPLVEEIPEGFIMHSVNASNVEELFATEVYPKLNLN
ncbi:MAG: (2Fe-2S) ferredoxin domain-containing protein [Bacteroidales bacterium]|nr:(2Fe-2S) ferredoxin domain-containing protein [Bacteroidales bacterium]